MFDFSIITSWVHGLLTSLMPLGLAVFIECVIVGGCLLLMYTVIAILMIYTHRKNIERLKAGTESKTFIWKPRRVKLDDEERKKSGKEHDRE